VTPLDPAAIDTIFRKARTANGFLDKPVSMDLLKQVYELAALGPTSMNTQPTRYVFLQSKEARERLLPAMSPGNLDKTRTAPVTVIVATDTKFYEYMPTPAWPAAPPRATAPWAGPTSSSRRGRWAWTAAP
jgi:3-hydroxypropanoate dehydrogenase